MAKKYFWLKLKDDFFDDDTISYIEEQENGVLYVNFYLKMCLKSLKTDGKLIRLVGETLIPYDANSLSKLTNTPVDTVLVAMKLFESIGLVKIMDSGEIYMSQINEMIGSETDKASTMRRIRAENKNGNNVTEMLPKCYTEIEREKELDKEIYLEQETEREGEELSPTLDAKKIYLKKIYDSWSSHRLPLSNASRGNFAMFETIELRPVLSQVLAMSAQADDVLQAIDNAAKVRDLIEVGASWYQSPDNFRQFVSKIDRYMPGAFDIAQFTKKQVAGAQYVDDDKIEF